MIEGLWTVRFQGVQFGAGGVAVFLNGRVYGGDSGYTYLGTFEDSSKLKARVRVQQFAPGVPNALGQQGDFELEFEGTMHGDAINVTASVVGRPQLRLTAQLTKKASIP